MNTEWLYCFLEASRHKSFSKASEKLNLTQPALSKQIRHLEELLGVELFKRSASGVELTEEGSLLQERIIPFLSELEAIKTELINHQKLSSIRIGTIPSLAAYYIPDKLVGMQQDGIQTELNVRSTSAEIIELLCIGSIDAGMIHKASRIPARYWTVGLFHEPYYAILPSRHPLADHQAITLEQLKDEPLIVYPSQCDIRSTIVKAFQASGLEPRLALEINFGESIPGFVAAGAGITVLPEIIVNHISHLAVKAVPIEGFPETRTIHLVCARPELGKKLARYFKAKK
ncbi:LysR family transcriptional regulator [Paenibacillus cremeus]|uniref:LysR family transcriptional regulator n=1 Tax=Paenibacillus cremeus TaxID=2163881 RepID=A0A559K378_9BACL|nr:LysR family transcriptional regulator [Paenibacillus cremeus]TVY06557.1 LysR family transcriptional regulator [Paenibacillus cremeus]